MCYMVVLAVQLEYLLGANVSRKKVVGLGTMGGNEPIEP